MAVDTTLSDLFDQLFPDESPDDITPANLRTALKALAARTIPKGGTIGQVISKNTNADFDTEWSDAGPALPALPGVTNLTASVAAGHSVLNWDVAPGATGYKLLRNGVQIATPAAPPYDAIGLTNGQAYEFTVIPTAAGSSDGPAAVVSVTPQAPSVSNDVEWMSTDTYPLPGLLDADNLDYDHSAAIGAPGSNIIVDAHGHPDNYHMVIRFKDNNILPTKYDESGTANVNIAIPGVQFPEIFQARGFTYIVTNEAGVTFNPDPAARVTLHT